MNVFAKQPLLREALRNSLFGWGATTWISPRRRRVARLVFPVTGVVVGLLFGALLGRLPAAAFGGPAYVLLGLMLLFLLAGFLVYDVNMGLEMLDKRATESDLALARQIQQRMLPTSLPRVPGYELHAFQRPARAVGGDAYDALLLADGRLMLAVADVSGKGAAAALLMMGVLARLRALARTGRDVATLVRDLNEAMVAETEVVHFSTLVVVELDPVTGRLDYVNAGNTPPLLVRRDGRAESLQAGGVPVGMLPDVPFTAGTATLGAGDRLLLFTDGAQDADDAGAVLLDDDELARLVRAGADDDAATLMASLVRELDARAPAEPFDDATLLLLGREASPA